LRLAEENSQQLRGRSRSQKGLFGGLSGGAMTSIRSSQGAANAKPRPSCRKRAKTRSARATNAAGRRACAVAADAPCSGQVACARSAQPSERPSQDGGQNATGRTHREFARDAANTASPTHQSPGRRCSTATSGSAKSAASSFCRNSPGSSARPPRTIAAQR
jgi:hypothetical protein